MLIVSTTLLLMLAATRRLPNDRQTVIGWSPYPLSTVPDASVPLAWRLGETSNACLVLLFFEKHLLAIAEPRLI